VAFLTKIKKTVKMIPAILLPVCIHSCRYLKMQFLV